MRLLMLILLLSLIIILILSIDSTILHLSPWFMLFSYDCFWYYLFHVPQQDAEEEANDAKNVPENDEDDGDEEEVSLRR